MDLSSLQTTVLDAPKMTGAVSPAVVEKAVQKVEEAKKDAVQSEKVVPAPENDLTERFGALARREQQTVREKQAIAAEKSKIEADKSAIAAVKTRLAEEDALWQSNPLEL